jgi:alpha-glucosidase
VLFDQNDVHTHYRTDEFMYGDSILVCPILEPNSKGRRMYFPYGNWYNFWNNEVVEGGKEMWVDADIDSMPIFVKEGAIIPKFPIQQYVGEKNIEQVVLDIYYKEGKESSLFYDDAHDGYDYTKGRYSLRTFKLTGKRKEIILQQHKEGKYTASYETFEMHFHGLPFKIKKIQIDNVEIPLKEIKVNGDSVMQIDKNFTEIHIIGE